MKRSRYLFENNTSIDYHNITENDVIDYDTLCMWRLNKLYNQLQHCKLEFCEKCHFEKIICEFKDEYKDVLMRLNII